MSDIWNSFVEWFYSTNGSRVITGAIVPFIAIVVAGVIAGLIGRGSTKRAIALSDRENKAAAITALISAARKAAVWNTLAAPEQSHIEHLIGEADIRLRLLPMTGTALAADWAAHEIADMQKNAVSFSFQAEQSMLNFRDRLIEWQSRPNRAKKLFKNDIDSWAYDTSLADRDLVTQQQAWAKQQVDTVAMEANPADDTQADATAHSVAEETPLERALRPDSIPIEASGTGTGTGTASSDKPATSEAKA